MLVTNEKTLKVKKRAWDMLVRMEANKRAVCLWSFNDQEPGQVCAVKILALGLGLTTYSAPSRRWTLGKQAMPQPPHQDTGNEKRTDFLGA